MEFERQNKSASNFIWTILRRINKIYKFSCRFQKHSSAEHLSTHRFTERIIFFHLKLFVLTNWLVQVNGGGEGTGTVSDFSEFRIMTTEYTKRELEWSWNILKLSWEFSRLSCWVGPNFSSTCHIRVTKDEDPTAGDWYWGVVRSWSIKSANCSPILFVFG